MHKAGVCPAAMVVKCSTVFGDDNEVDQVVIQ